MGSAVCGVAWVRCVKVEFLHFVSFLLLLLPFPVATLHSPGGVSFRCRECVVARVDERVYVTVSARSKRQLTVLTSKNGPGCQNAHEN